MPLVTLAPACSRVWTAESFMHAWFLKYLSPGPDEVGLAPSHGLTVGSTAGGAAKAPTAAPTMTEATAPTTTPRVMPASSLGTTDLGAGWPASPSLVEVTTTVTTKMRSDETKPVMAKGKP